MTLRRCLLSLVRGSDRCTHRPPSFSAPEVSDNRILGLNVYSDCHAVAFAIREAIRTTSMTGSSSPEVETPGELVQQASAASVWRSIWQPTAIRDF